MYYPDFVPIAIMKTADISPIVLTTTYSHYQSGI